MVALAVLLAACSSSPSTNAAKPTGFAALTGKRLSGTSSSWLAIASPAAHPVDVAGTSTPPVITDNESAFQSVTFFDFPTSAAAATFYSNPPLASVLTSSPLQVLSAVEGFQPLAGASALPAPSRWLDLRECLYAAGHAVQSVVGTPSGGKIDAAGNCSIGAPRAIGLGMIFHQGTVVVIVETLGGDGALESTSALEAAPDAKVVTHSKALASSASALLHTVGIS